MYNTKGILVTTTASLEGWEIQQYLRPVSSHLVAGTNLFSDFFASLTDVFGGRSQTYQRQISTLYNDAVEQLKAKAYELGANCILGLSVDMDEISGKGKSMFMINATGTAVIAQKNKNTNFSSNGNGHLENISSDSLANLRKRKNIIEAATTNKLELNEENWSFLMENKVHEVFPFLLESWKTQLQYDSENAPKLQTKMGQYIASLPADKQFELVYGTLLNEKNEKIINALSYFIRDLHLVDLDLIEKHLENGAFEQQKRTLIPLLYDRPFYNKEDLSKLRRLVELINSTFKERGQLTMKKQLFSSKEKEAWTCECGKQNDIGSYCNGCSKDIYGFKSSEVKPQEAIQSIEDTISLVEENLQQSQLVTPD
jgi:uncharacterized protein YbjQ (UPF0145 family)/CDGSH-type Zn-finger protein